MLYRYNSFVEDLLLESLINESMIYFSPALRKQLNKVSDDISDDLLGIESTDIKPDITFIDLDKEGFLSFSTMRNVKKILDEKFPDLKDIYINGIDLDQKPNKDLADDIWYIHNKEYGNLKSSLRGMGNFDDGVDPYVKGRNQIAIGRLVNKVFPGKYNSKQVEEFVNSFKAAVEKSGEHFELVSGDDIAFWYNSDNYKEKSGTLGNSCMAQKRNIFNIYVKNPDVCRLLILREDDKILGRALIWKFKSIHSGIGEKFEGVEYFMDRQYTIKDSDVNKFRNFAKEQGWIYKTNNNHHSFTNITYNGNEINVDIDVQVDRFGGDYDYQRYPYMDTFRRYDPRIGKLYNDDNQESDQEGCYILDDTGGGYSEVEGGVWSEWHDRMIPEDEAVYSDQYGDHLLRDYAVRIDVGSSRRRGWYHQDDDDVVYDEHSDEYVHVDDAVYSDIYGNWIWDERAVRTITEIYTDGDVENSEGNWCYVNDRDIIELREMRNMLWYIKLSDKYSDWDNYKYIYKELLTKNYKDEYIPEKLERIIYKVGEPKSSDSPDIYGVEWLLEEDAIALDYEINMDNSRVIDIIQYNKNVDEVLENVLNKLETKIKQLDDIMRGEGQTRMKFDDDDEYRKSIHELRIKLITRFEELDSEEWHNL